MMTTSASHTPLLRPAQVQDLPEITDIYNEAVLNTVATFDTKPRSLEDRKNWFLTHDETHPVYVIEKDNNIIAWACLSRWSDRAAYDGTVELSVYVHHQHRDQGYGRKLMEQMLKLAREQGLHSIISRIAGGNEKSTHLHLSLGFEMIGIMKEVGFKFDRWIDVYLYQILL